MNRMGGWHLAAIVSWTAIGAGGLEARSHADAIHPWAGAGAEVQVFNQWNTQSGTVAALAAQGQKDVAYIPDLAPERTWPVYGRARAEATGRPEALLRVDGSYSASTYGSFRGSSEGTTVRASATWTGDAVHVQVPEGANPPESIRVHVALDFLRSSSSFGSMSLRLNDRTFAARAWGGEYEGVYDLLHFYELEPGSGFPQPIETAHLPEGFDSLVFPGPADSRGGVTGRATFHLDLPVNASGDSAPFSLGLESNLSLGIQSNANIFAEHRDFTVSLTDVTLPDGTPLASRGYAVSFASGLPWPAAVPEPASLAGWGLVAALAGAAARSRRRMGAGAN
ncbi:MAG TPA: hypothetical protein VF590_08655 [Isosphaeraceae bacterium]|jgi:hypothetical protein